MAQAQITQTQQVESKPLPLTLEMYLEAYGVQPVEVIHGELIPMSPNQRLHVRIARDLLIELDRFVRERKLGQVWPEAAYVLDGNFRENWVEGAQQPDVSFITAERIAAHNKEFGETGGPWWLAPDLAVEIVSPTDRFTLLLTKVANYLKFGAKLVWLIDPQRRVVHVYTPDQPDGRILHDADILPGDPVLPGWSTSIKTLLDATLE